MKIIPLKYSILFFICTFFAANAQDKTNQLDANGKKDGLWIGSFEDSKRPRYEGTFKNGVEVGTFKYFDDTKAKSILATRVFSDNGKVAQTTFFDQKNNKVSEGKTINRLNEGVWNYYHKASKQLMKVEHYKNGKLNGMQTIYYPSGKIAETRDFKNGEREGMYKVYFENGIISEESTFKNNQYHGPAIFRDANGQVVSKGNFVNDEKKGIWEFYNDGKLIKKEKYPLRIKFEKILEVPEH